MKKGTSSADVIAMGYRLPGTGERIAQKVAPSRLETKTTVELRRKAGGGIVMPDPEREIPNKTEQRFADTYSRLWKPSRMLYEKVTLRLPSGTRYTTDWLFEWDDGIRCHIECKAEFIHRDASREKFLAAIAAFPFWKFTFARWNGSEWILSGYQRK